MKKSKVEVGKNKADANVRKTGDGWMGNIYRQHKPLTACNI